MPLILNVVFLVSGTWSKLWDHDNRLSEIYNLISSVLFIFTLNVSLYSIFYALLFICDQLQFLLLNWNIYLPVSLDSLSAY